MSDSGSGMQQVAEEIVETTGEVAQEAQDFVGAAIEQATQSITPQPSPQQIQQKQEENQKKEIDRQKQLTYTRAWLKNQEADQKKVIMENKQKEQQRVQSQVQEEQIKKSEGFQQKQQSVDPSLAFVGKGEKKGPIGG